MAGGNQVPVRAAADAAKSKTVPAPVPAGDLPGPLVDADNAAPGYQDYRNQVSTDDLIAQARARMAASSTAAPAAGTPPGAPAAAGSAQPASETPAAGQPAPDASVHAAGEAVPAQPAPAAAVRPVPVMGAPAPAAPAVSPVAVAKDVGRGVLDTIEGKTIVGGLGDAFGNTLQANNEFAQWLDDKTKGTWLDHLKLPEDMRQQLLGMTGNMAAKAKSVPASSSATGGLVRSGIAFIAGLVPAARGLKIAGLGTKAASAAGGAISAFFTMAADDPGLSNLVQEHPAIANPITEWLAAKPDDNAALNRFKHALEGAGFGALTEGVAKAVSFVKAARAVKVQEGATAAPSQILQPALKPDDLQILGDVGEDAAAPIVQMKPREPGQFDQGVAAKLQEGLDANAGTDAGAAAAGLTKDAQVNRLSAAFGAPVDLGNKTVAVNFARINTPADVQTALGQMTEAFPESVDAARRGVRSNEVTQAAADDLGMSVADLLRRRNGQPLNAEEGLAARNLWAASGAKLLETAQAAAKPNASAADLFAFRKMMATHYAIQAEVLGARAETARALQAWSIPAGGGQEQMKALQAMLDGSGGADVSKAMAQRLALLAESGATPAELNQAIRKGAFAKTMDAVREIWINGLLSSPTTHIVNTASNFNVAMQQIVERGVAGKIAKLTRSGGVADGEAQAMMYGMLSGLGDAFKASWQTMRGTAVDTLGKLETPRTPAVSAAAFNLDEAGGVGRVVDFLGSTFRVPGKALETQDAFFKSIGYRMELHAQAYRQAVSEGLDGPALGQRVAGIVADPPENIRLASADAALYNTFTNETGDFGKKLMALRNGGGALNPLPFIIPFVRTPINIARYSFERTPLAPLVGQWRQDIAAGGARRDVALARMATGSAAMAVATDYAMQGLVSGKGPSDPAERATLQREGWQPYSIKVGDKWVSYNRMDPFGQTLGFAADITEAMRRGDIDPADVDSWNEVMAGGIAAVSQFTINKTYLKGLADFANVMTDPERYGRDYVDNFAASFLPFTAAAGSAERIVDPTNRQAFTPMDAVLAKIPVLSERLVPSMNLWGDPTQAGGAVMPGTVAGKVFDALTPAQVTQEKHAPIDDEMLKQRAFQLPIGKKSSFAGVEVDFRNWPDVYKAYVQLAGNGAKNPAWNMGAKDYLNAVVSGKHAMSQVYSLYSDGPDGGKAKFIKNAILDYRHQAQQQILADPKFRAFADFIANGRKVKQQQSMPAGTGGAVPAAAGGATMPQVQ